MAKYAVYSKWYWKNGVPEVDFNKERPSVLEERKRNHEEGAQIIEENVGPYLGQMSTV